MIELFPYDLLLIATHCGDSDGYRWTYEFIDSDGIDRTVVVDIALGVARTGKEDLLNVTQFMRVVSLDGVDWYDPDKAEKICVGNAMIDFFARTGSRGDLEPVDKKRIPRVVGSAALKMFDNNYISTPVTLAGDSTPIVINNACGSWHRLAGDMTFGNARAYIGTLFMVSDGEAHDVVVKLLDRYYGRPLPNALWSAQRQLYGSGVRRPYVMVGVYTQRLRGSHINAPRYIVQQLSRGLRTWQARLRNADPAMIEGWLCCRTALSTMSGNWLLFERNGSDQRLRAVVPRKFEMWF
jgi:hypothetical protein